MLHIPEHVYYSLQTLLLAHYDGIMICNPNTNVLWQTSGTLSRFPVPATLITTALQKNEKVSQIQEDWEGKQVFITVIPVCFPNFGLEHEKVAIVGFHTLKKKTSENELVSKMKNNSGVKSPKSTLIFQSKQMEQVIRQAELVAKTSASCLITGESGVGKEMIAKIIHQSGSRANQPFVKVNCGAIPENLLESELFGYTKGAFTGADPKGKPGYFRQADKGIIFLDEIGELSLHHQVKLLRVLQEREVIPLGGTESFQLDVQIIAATNRNLEKMVQDGTFRKDLYYRLNVVPINIPSLRQRSEDIPILTNYFLHKYTEKYQKQVQLNSEVIELLTVYPWYGNVRELENFIERIVVTAEYPFIDLEHVQSYLPRHHNDKMSVPVYENLIPLQTAIDQVETQLIELAMKKYKSIKLAARALEISQPTLSRKYKKIKEAKEASFPRNNTNHVKIFEKELDKQLRSIASVTAASLNVEDIKKLKQNISENNPYYGKLRHKLTCIRKFEGKIEWNYLWMIDKDNRVINLVADDKLNLKPGEEYTGPPEMMKVVYNAWQGQTGVTRRYIDKFGEWKSSLAPIKDENGQVIAILGCDFSNQYVTQEIQKLIKVLSPTTYAHNPVK
jgi:transcriptional regulator with PAS, ATPase and Fis domain